MNDLNVTFVERVNKPGEPTRQPFNGIVEAITKRDYWKLVISELRKMEDKEKRQEFKLNKLPAFNMGEFNGKVDNEHFISTQYIIFDIDELNCDELSGLRQDIIKDLKPFFCFISPGGSGLKICQRLDNPITDEETYKFNYSHYIKVLEKEISCKIDSTPDPRRLCFLTHDPEMFINVECTDLKVLEMPDNGKPKPVKDVPITDKKIVQEMKEVEEQVKWLEDNNKDITEGYDEWIRVGLSFADRFGENGRELFHRASALYKDYDPVKCDKKYDNFLKSVKSKSKSKVGLGTFYQYCKDMGAELKKEPEPERELTGIEKRVFEPFKEEQPATRPDYRIISAEELRTMEIPEPNWAVKGFIPEGLSLLAAHPKAGKSFLALNIAYAVSSGGLALGWFDVEMAGDVIYVGYESTLKSYKSRLSKMISEDPSGFWPSNLFLISNDFPNREENGHEHLRLLIESHPNLKLLIIDTMEKFIVRGGNENYSIEVKLLNELYLIATQNCIAILLIHHTRKMEAISPFDTISGSYGIEGALDGVMVLHKEDNLKKLTYRGREIEEQSYVIEFDKQFFMWRIKGDADTYAKTIQQNDILNALKKNPFSTYKEVADELGIPSNAANVRLSRMYKDNRIEKTGDKYHVSEF